MAEYKVEVKTGDHAKAGTWDHILLTLIGDEGESERTNLDNFGRDFKSGKVGIYTIKCSSTLGKLLLLKVEKDRCSFFKEDEWYCSTMKVTTPEGDHILFPCHRWISRGESVQLRGGPAMKTFEEKHPLLIEHRKNELEFKKKLFQWSMYTEGLPYNMDCEDRTKLPAELRLPESTQAESKKAMTKMGHELMFKGSLNSTDTWESLEDATQSLKKRTKASEYIKAHWMEDDFFGYHFLNGNNPMTIKRCTWLPHNFPVRDEMVGPFLREGTSLYREIQEGNIFIWDMKEMDGIPGREYDGEPLQSITPGLCLFYLNPDKQLKPIAIQLQQKPSAENPIFLPSDSETDWLLAKIYIKSADAIEHQSVRHLLFTHFIAEVFAVAALRCFPVIHPLYKLLIPHFRGTIAINSMPRETLIETLAVAASSLGKNGCIELMKRSMSEVTYSSICLPQNISARGLESIPNFYYRDDGLKLWNIIHEFVCGVVKFYYPTDCHVCEDSELQEWIKEIFFYGFHGRQCSGIPSSFHCIHLLSRFLTMVIFTCSTQHAAVHHGQYDYYSNMPNCSLLLRKPPPTTKGETSMKTILETLPNVGETVGIVGMMMHLTLDYSTFVPLGSYPEERFDDPAILQMIKEFQAELSFLIKEITARNSQIELPYEHLLPSVISTAKDLSS